MTLQETESIIRFILSSYNTFNLSQEKVADMIKLWQHEFSATPREIVIKGLRKAMAKSPAWIPPIPLVRDSMNEEPDPRDAMIPKEKSAMQEYKDKHCGKTKEEWSLMLQWEQSDEGKSKIASYHERLVKLIKGGQNNGSQHV